MTTTSSDAALVAGHLAGDPSALGGIYDRYADSLHDTAAAMLNDRSEAADALHDVILVAAERLDQLRDPDRLKPWLFAILRNEVYRRTKKRRRTIATDFSRSDDGYDMADDRHLDPSDDVAEGAAGDDLAGLVRNAARGLDERDQLVLELSVRQGLGGQDLADALGVSANQSYTLVHRMRERVEKSLGAYVVAKAGRRDCDDLDKLLGSWDGEFTVLIRKRVARHVDGCDVCGTSRSKVAPFSLFAAAPVYAAPAALRSRVLDAALAQAGAAGPAGSAGQAGHAGPAGQSGTAGPAGSAGSAGDFTADGFPKLVRAGRSAASWIAPTAAASLIIVAAGAGLWLMTRSAESIVRSDEAVVVASEVATTTTTTEVAVIVDPPADTIAATTTTSTTSTSSIPSPSTTTPITIPVDGIPPKDRPTTIPSATEAPVTTRAPSPAPTPQTAPPASPAPTPTTTTTTAAPSPQPTTTSPGPTTTSTTTSTSTVPPSTTTTAPPTPGRLSVSGGSIDLGSGASTGSVTISNSGELPIDFTVGGDPGPFSVSPTSGTLEGGASIQLIATLNRSAQGEGTKTGSMQISAGGQSFNVALSARVERAPVIGGSNGGGSCSFSTSSGGGRVDLFGSATISDESSVSATISFFGPGGQSASATMGPDGSTWFGATSVGYSVNSPGSVQGGWSFTISAVDARGNSASRSGSFTVSSC